MPVVAHPSVSKKINRKPFQSVRNETFKCLVVSILEENIMPSSIVSKFFVAVPSFCSIADCHKKHKKAQKQ